MTKEDFISMVVNELLQDQFSVFLHQKVKVEDCGGWFDYEEREVTAAMQNPMGFEILVHEYNHYRQWKDDNEWFKARNENVCKVFDWIGGRIYTKKTLRKAFEETVMLELDCERRSIATIEKYDLPVDVDKYIRAANAYLLFYQYVHQKRKWCKKSPYNDPTMLSLMSNELHDLEYYMDPDNIPEKAKVHLENCFIE